MVDSKKKELPPSMANIAESTTAVRKEKTPAVDPWLHAWFDPVANLSAFSGCLRLADLQGDGDTKLLVADMDKKLKIYKGTALVSEHALLDVPVSLCTFYTDNNRPRTPAVAVASGPYVFIYRNLRPYFKFTLPPVDIDRVESEVWLQLRGDKIDAQAAYDQLSTARDNGSQLSSRSLDLLSMESARQRQEFVDTNKLLPVLQQTVITCMETIKKNMDEESAISSLVIGTENKQVLILDPPGSTILTRCTLPGVPVFIAVSGLYDVDYRVVVACRNGNCYTIKNGEVTGTVIELEALPCGLVRLDRAIVVATMDHVVHSFHIKGKKNWSIHMPHAVSCLEVMRVRKTRTLNALLVSLSNGEVRLYQDKHLVTTLNTTDVITGLRFGTFGREEGSLVCVFKSGSLGIKMLRRAANLNASTEPPGAPPEQDIPLNVPKKTKLYVEQTQRERDQATEMHRIFQRDLCKLRLSTARSYVQIITDGQGPLSYASGTSLRLNAQVQGLGPLFKIKLNVQNAGTKAMTDVPLTFSYSHQLYKLRRSVLTLPLLIPGVLYHYDLDVECVDENGGADSIRIFVCNPASCLPIVSAVVNMPMSEPVFEEG